MALLIAAYVKVQWAMDNRDTSEPAGAFITDRDGSFDALAQR